MSSIFKFSLSPVHDGYSIILWQVPDTQIVTVIQQLEILFHCYATSKRNRYIRGNEYGQLLEPTQRTHRYAILPTQRNHCEWKINREAKCSVFGPAKSALRHGSRQP
jgi:hypothetical protein